MDFIPNLKGEFPKKIFVLTYFSKAKQANQFTDLSEGFEPPFDNSHLITWILSTFPKVTQLIIVPPNWKHFPFSKHSILFVKDLFPHLFSYFWQNLLDQLSELFTLDKLCKFWWKHLLSSLRLTRICFWERRDCKFNCLTRDLKGAKRGFKRLLTHIDVINNLKAYECCAELATSKWWWKFLCWIWFNCW